jgi:hypothetical protein
LFIAQWADMGLEIMVHNRLYYIFGNEIKSFVTSLIQACPTMFEPEK